MSVPLLITLNIVVWLAVLAYVLRLAPPLAKRWNGWLALVLVAAAAGISAVSYRQAMARKVQEAALKHYYAGIDEVQRGNLQEAEKELERALTLQPGHPDAKRKLDEIRQQKPAEQREQRKETRVVPVPSSSPAQPSPPPPASPVEPSPGTPGEKPKPAPHKPSPFEIRQYALDLTLDPEAHSLDALATVRVRSRKERLPSLDFSLHPECKPTAVEVDGARAEFTHVNDLLTVKPTRAVPGKGEATVAVHYGRKGPALLKSSGDLISTQGTFLRSESRWYPATGELDFRSPVRVRARVPSGYTVVSVGALKSVTKLGNQTEFLWETDRYASMVSLTAAKYVQSSLLAAAPKGADARAPLKITCYTYPEHKGRAAEFLKEASAMVRYFERRFGPYPYEKLAVAEIPLFPGGYGTTSFVMLIDRSFATKRVDREFLSHEIAHQWWGNSVFPQGLGAAWLTEAFANYSAWTYAAAIGGNPRVLQRRVAKAISEYFEAADRKGDQALRETDPYQPVGAREEILYEKGAVVLHMLRHQLGDAVFWRALRKYADKYRFGLAKIEDFQAVMEAESGQKLDWFFEQWLGRTGGLSFAYSFRTDPVSAKESRLTLMVTQAKPAYRARMKVALGVGNTVENHVIELSEEQQSFTFPVRGPVSSVLFDPDNTYLMRPPKWVVPQ